MTVGSGTHNPQEVRFTREGQGNSYLVLDVLAPVHCRANHWEGGRGKLARQRYHRPVCHFCFSGSVVPENAEEIDDFYLELWHTALPEDGCPLRVLFPFQDLLI